MFFRLKIVTNISMLLLMLMSVGVLAQPRIDLTEGSLFLTGGLDVKYELIDFAEPAHQFELNSDLGGGYFVLDGLAVGLSVRGKWNIAPTSGGSMGLKVFSTYFFDTNSVIFPYLGGNVTPTYSMTQKQFQLWGGVDTGILVSLSESVALDFGLRPEVFFKIYDNQKWKVTVPGGFFGVRAVF